MKTVTKQDCVGCTDNFYNQTQCGLNETGGQPECWSFKTAKMVMARDVPVSMRPPYTFPETLRPSCYRAKGYVRVKKEALDTEGFWKR